MDLDSTETRRLLEQARQNDGQVFEQLFARHRQFLRRVVEVRLDDRLRSRIDPSDVVQETQLEAFRRIHDFLLRQPMAFRLWLHRMACERLIMLKRRHCSAGKRSIYRELSYSERSSMILANSFADLGSSPSGRFNRRELVLQVRSALNELADSDREVLVMRNVECLSNQEVAQLLGIEPATASQRYGRALLRLRKELLRRGLGDRDE